MRKAAIIISLVFLTFLMGGCASENSAAPGEDQPHPLGAQWLLPTGHAAAAIDRSLPCFSCHQLAGGETGAPACSECHTAGSPNFVLGTCDSCHATPPDGDSRPNRAGAHAAHNDLPNVAGVCATCHDGAGTGTTKHFDAAAPADVTFLAAYNAKTGSASFTADLAAPGTGTCSNVSCHGGQQTPDWATGQIDPDRDCTSCHELGTAFQTPQYNSPYSGQHAFHLGIFPGGCILCHDPAKLAGEHFVGLDTPEFEGIPAATMHEFYDPQTMSCNTNGVCHPAVEEPRSW